ncbi:MAG: S1C family serine protease [bacterium]
MRKVLIISTIVVFLSGLALGIFGSRWINPSTASAQTNVLTNEESVYIDVAERVGPSVVNINTVSVVQYFFQPVPMEGAGSGVIISSDGYILTNNHVVEGAKKIRVTLANGKSLDGRLVGRDPFTDIAVVKVNATDLPAAKLADSSKVKVGQIAIAIGNPFGLGKTVTAGIVSALDRSIQTDKGVLIESLMQTDAAINPGNSGGALVNSSGEVIGINTAIYQGAQGIGFAIPSNIAKGIAEEIMKKGYAAHTWLGIAGETLDSQTALFYNLPVDYGVVVADIAMGSPAEKAKLQRGDIIIGINNEQIDSLETLALKVLKGEKGKEITLKVLRNNKIIDLRATLGERPKVFATNGDVI